MEYEIIESCLTCKSYDRLLKYNEKKFCPDYPEKMSILNTDIIGGYVCDKHIKIKARPIIDYKTAPNLDKIQQGFNLPYSSGMKVVGMLPLGADDELMEKFKKQLRKMGFKI